MQKKARVLFLCTHNSARSQEETRQQYRVHRPKQHLRQWRARAEEDSSGQAVRRWMQIGSWSSALAEKPKHCGKERRRQPHTGTLFP